MNFKKIISLLLIYFTLFNSFYLHANYSLSSPSVSDTMIHNLENDLNMNKHKKVNMNLVSALVGLPYFITFLHSLINDDLAKSFFVLYISSLCCLILLILYVLSCYLPLESFFFKLKPLISSKTNNNNLNILRVDSFKSSIAISL